MIELREDRLVFQFPEVHADAKCRIEFQRTLRIPDDRRHYPLPPGLGRFPLNHVDDYADTVPAAWNEHGGIFLPMHQSEALWLNFSGTYPMAVKVAAGKINAVTGQGWTNELSDRPQDYLVVPDQRWLDGFCVKKGSIRQFVAMPLGGGYTAEEQLTRAAAHGGLQIVVSPMQVKRYEEIQREKEKERRMEEEKPIGVSEKMGVYEGAAPTLGLAPGGLMFQEIYEDPYGFEAWDMSARSRCFVHLLNSLQFLAVTGAEPPNMPPAAEEYTNAGLPWFEYYAGDREALHGAKQLADLASVDTALRKKGKEGLAGNRSVLPKFVEKLGSTRVRTDDF